MTVKKSAHIRIISAVIDTWFGIKEREIFLPDTNEDVVQFSLRDNGRAIGILRVETEEQFNELFDSIKTLSFYTDFDKAAISEGKLSAGRSYSKAVHQVWEAYDKAFDQAQEDHDKATGRAWIAREKAEAQAKEVYAKAVTQAQEDHDKAWQQAWEVRNEAMAQAKKAEEEASA